MGIAKRAVCGVLALWAGYSAASVPTREQDNEGSALYFKARQAPELKQKEEILSKAIDFSEKEAARDPKNPGPQYWKILNLEALVQARRNLWSLKIIRKLETELNQFVEKFPSHAYAGGLRTLGYIYREAPRFISIGSTKKAEECFRRALALAPEFPGNHIALIELLWNDGRIPEAKIILENLMKMKGWLERRYGEFEPYKAEWEAKVRSWMEIDKI